MCPMCYKISLLCLLWFDFHIWFYPVPRSVQNYMLHHVRRMAPAFVSAKMHVRPLAEKLLLLIFKANILFFQHQKDTISRTFYLLMS